jgi:hypothetical protein
MRRDTGTYRPPIASRSKNSSFDGAGWVTHGQLDQGARNRGQLDLRSAFPARPCLTGESAGVHVDEAISGRPLRIGAVEVERSVRQRRPEVHGDGKRKGFRIQRIWREQLCAALLYCEHHSRGRRHDDQQELKYRFGAALHGSVSQGSTSHGQGLRPDDTRSIRRALMSSINGRYGKSVSRRPAHR